MSSMDKKIRKAFEHITPNILGSVLSDCDAENIPTQKRKKLNTFQIREIGATAAAMVLLFCVGAAAAGIIGSGFNLNPSSYHGNPSVFADSGSDSADPEENIPVNDDPALDNTEDLSIVQDRISSDEAMDTAIRFVLGQHPEIEGVPTILDIVSSENYHDILLNYCGYVYQCNIHSLTADMTVHWYTEAYYAYNCSNVFCPQGEALKIALTHSGVHPDDLYSLAITQNVTQMSLQYQIDFSTIHQNYRYLINAQDGSMIDSNAHLREYTIDNYMSAVIDRTEAVQLALQDVARDSSEMFALFTDFHDGIYEIVLSAGDVEYSFDINAYNGTILACEKELLSGTSRSDVGSFIPMLSVSPEKIVPTPDIDVLVTENDALHIALTHAGLDIDHIHGSHVELDGYDDGTLYYELYFGSDQYDYEYEISALTGDILEAEKSQHQAVDTDKLIEKGKAIAVALTHVGVADEGRVSHLTVTLDDEEWKVCYEVSFILDGVRFTFDINATNGDILNYEKEDVSSDQIQPTDGILSEDLALMLALEHAGYQEAQISNLVMILDTEEVGNWHYDISFQADNWKFEFEIHAYSAQYLKCEQEALDN